MWGRIFPINHKPADTLDCPRPFVYVHINNCEASVCGKTFCNKSRRN